MLFDYLLRLTSSRAWLQFGRCPLEWFYLLQRNQTWTSSALVWHRWWYCLACLHREAHRILLLRSSHGHWEGAPSPWLECYLFIYPFVRLVPILSPEKSKWLKIACFIFQTEKQSFLYCCSTSCMFFAMLFSLLYCLGQYAKVFIMRGGWERERDRNLILFIKVNIIFSTSLQPQL